jgi:hypothetical protein
MELGKCVCVKNAGEVHVFGHGMSHLMCQACAEKVKADAAAVGKTLTIAPIRAQRGGPPRVVRKLSPMKKI